VKPRRDGKYVFYTLGDMRVLPMLDALHAMFCRELPRRRASGSN
jgi:hypothetical protein